MKDWEDFIQKIFSCTLTDEDEPHDERKKRLALLEADPEEWFQYYFPGFATAPAAQFHKNATMRVLQNKEWCEVRLWSRELAKSTRTMMEVFYLVFVGHKIGSERAEKESDAKSESAEKESGNMQGERVELDTTDREYEETEEDGEREYDSTALRSPHSALKKRCVILISNSLDNAERLLMPYRANLEYNARLIQDYGMQMGDGTWTASEFITVGGISFRAIGAGQSPRGTRNEATRPDIIIFDDVDTDSDCLNPEIVNKKWRWVEEAAIGTRSVSEPTTIIFCGNRIALDSCIQRATDIADITDTVNIRNEDGLSSWPEKNDEAAIDRVLSQKSYAAQQKEYFNNPITEGSVFKEMAYKPARPLNEYSMLVCYTDPSYKATSDYKATVLVGRCGSEFHVIKCFLDQATTAQMIDWHYRIMDLVNGESCYYFMEQVFMQDVLVKEVSDAGKRTGRLIPIKGDARRKPDKFMRIESLLEPMVRNGELFLNEAEQHNPHMMRLAEQFCAFAPGSRAHDDGPDAVEGAVWIITDWMSRRDMAGIKSGTKPVNNKRF